MFLFSVSLFFFFKQKTAYEMRISDWSSDVCSSDLAAGIAGGRGAGDGRGRSDEIARVQPVILRDRGRAIDAAGVGRDRDDVAQRVKLRIISGRRSAILPDLVGRRPDRGKVPPRIGGGETRQNQIGQASGRERVCKYV